ncbi:MAG TPA: glycosyltransferase family 39 protein, partial [Candidatus Bilamarchaeaceae archaeon]|nr:glycosyltransferase family 39 protein [Candidatus Bilamarchaeaceae archaeon]
IRTWGYPLFLAIGYVAGLDDFATAFLQVLGDGFAIFLMFRIGERWKAGNEAALLYAISPLFISFSFKLVSESFFIFVFLVAVWLFFKSMDKPDRKILVMAGLVLGFLILVRPIAIAFPVFFGGVYYWKHREWKELAYLLVPAYAVAGLWVVRNLVVLNELSFSRIGTISYACWTGPLLANDPQVDTRPWGNVQEELGLRHPDACTRQSYETVQRAAEVTTQMALHYPSAYVRHMANAALLLFAPQTPNYVMDILSQERPHLSLILFERGLDSSYLWEQVTRNGVYFLLLVIFSFYQLVLYALFTWGVWKSRKGWVLLVLVTVMAAYIVILQGPQILFSGYRYRMPIEPLLIIGAAFGLKKFLEERKWK